MSILNVPVPTGRRGDLLQGAPAESTAAHAARIAAHHRYCDHQTCFRPARTVVSLHDLGLDG